MKLEWFDTLGNWNPQLLREIKSNFTPKNLLVAVIISVVGQVLFFLTLQSQLPVLVNKAPEFHKYCTGKIVYETQRVCLLDSLGNFIINWQFWWLNLFVLLSFIGLFALLVGGTYLLINDLATEQRRGTLNFIRLSPQSPPSILIGKLLGVPSLLYLITILAVPLHLKAGLAAQIPLHLILSFYTVLICSCCFFYSAALLLSLVSPLAISSWVGSGTVLVFLWITQPSPTTGTLADWLLLLSPNQIIPYLNAATHLKFLPGLSMPALNAWQWFYLPLGGNAISLVIAVLLNYSLWTYWIWQALQRRFSNSSQTILSKQQSYFLVACFEVILLGFATKSIQGIPANERALYDWQFVLVFNLVMFLCLIVSLTPLRQVVQDWARYRQHQNKRIRWLLIGQDLMWSEKSPAVLAILFNLAIASTILIPWIFFNLAISEQIPALFSLLICCNFIMIYAALTLILRLRITQNTALWISGTLVAVTVLPTIILNLIAINSDKMTLWLFTPYAWVAIKSASQVSIMLAIVGQWIILGLFILQMMHDIKKMGESVSKALFTGSNLYSKR